MGARLGISKPRSDGSGVGLFTRTWQQSHGFGGFKAWPEQVDQIPVLA
jgi:hypothetical protein